MLKGIDFNVKHFDFEGVCEDWCSIYKNPLTRGVIAPRVELNESVCAFPKRFVCQLLDVHFGGVNNFERQEGLPLWENDQGCRIGLNFNMILDILTYGHGNGVKTSRNAGLSKQVYWHIEQEENTNSTHVF